MKLIPVIKIINIKYISVLIFERTYALHKIVNIFTINKHKDCGNVWLLKYATFPILSFHAFYKLGHSFSNYIT